VGDRPGVPICLCEGMTLRSAVDKDHRLSIGEVDADSQSLGAAPVSLRFAADRGTAR